MVVKSALLNVYSAGYLTIILLTKGFVCIWGKRGDGDKEWGCIKSSICYHFTAFKQIESFVYTGGFYPLLR